MLNVLNIQGTVVTVDAPHCQRETLEQIRGQKGHVVVQVKGNQVQLKKTLDTSFYVSSLSPKHKLSPHYLSINYLIKTLCI